MIIGLQIVSLGFSFLMIYFAVLNFRRNELSINEVMVWTGIWLFAVLAIVFPDLLQTFAKEFKFARLFDMMVVGAFILVFTMVAKAYIAARRMERKIDDYVRQDALKNVKKPNK